MGTEEKRKYPRLNASVQIHCAYISEPQWDNIVTETVTSKDVGPQGLCFYSKTPMRVDSALKIKFTDPQTQQCLEGFSRVAWCRLDAARKCWAVGVEFLAVAEGEDAPSEEWLKQYCEA